MIFKILKRLSEGYHKAILAQKSTKKHFAKFGSIIFVVGKSPMNLMELIFV